MAQALSHIQSLGLSIQELKNKAAGPPDEDDPPLFRAKKMRRCFQKTVSKELTSQVKVHPASRMRHKLDRWNLTGFPGPTAARYLRSLQVLKRLLPPRVAAASLRTAWNGWCTHRRFQQHGACRFACTSFVQEDSIEHFSCCQVCTRFLKKRLHYRGHIDKGHLVVLGANQPSRSEEDIVRLGLWAYVIYKAFNHLRNSTRQLGPEETEGLFEQSLRDAVQGHEGATHFVENCWRQGYRHSDQVQAQGVEDADQDEMSN